jgi:hypothetical protein
MASGSCVPHQQAEHMTAPTRSRTTSMKTLANGEPSTHDPGCVKTLEVAIVTQQTKLELALYESFMHE